MSIERSSPIESALRCVVTALDGQGRSVAAMAGPPWPIYRWPDGGGLYEIWTEPAGEMHRTEARQHTDPAVRLCPGEGEVKVRWFTITPTPTPPPEPAEVEAVVAAGFAELGAADARRDIARHPAMHLTQTLDAITVVSGRVRLILDADERLLGPGDVVVQRGTNHAWVCDGPEPVLMVAVLISRPFAEQERAHA